MTRTRTLVIVALAVSVTAMGCAQPEQRPEAPPERPAELDQLNVFVGKWKGTAEIGVPGQEQPVSFEGTSQVRWASDNRWYLIEEGTYEAEEGTMHGLGIWAWDARKKVFRTWWFEDGGKYNKGKAWYDEASGTWKFQGKGRSLITGEETYGEGTSRMISDDEMQWQWTEWDSPWKFRKLMDVQGTSRRVE